MKCANVGVASAISHRSAKIQRLTVYLVMRLWGKPQLAEQSGPAPAAWGCVSEISCPALSSSHTLGLVPRKRENLPESIRLSVQQHYDGQRLETACDLCGDTGALCAKVCAADSQKPLHAVVERPPRYRE